VNVCAEKNRKTWTPKAKHNQAQLTRVKSDCAQLKAVPRAAAMAMVVLWPWLHDNPWGFVGIFAVTTGAAYAVRYAYRRGLRIHIEFDPNADEEGPPKRVAIYGGAFNPITNGHLQLATEIVHSGIVDEVWICPCGPRPDKPNVLPPDMRLAMCEISINQGLSPMFPINIADHEVNHANDLADPDGQVATYDSLCWLRETYPKHEFSFVVGSDWLQPGTDLRTWTSKDGCTGDKLVSEFDFLVAPRPGYDVEDLSVFGPRFKWVQLPHNFRFSESNASSTEVRKRAKREWTADPMNGNAMQALNGLVQPGVLSFILRHRLYAPMACPQPQMSSRMEIAYRSPGEKGVEIAAPTRVAVLGGAFSPVTNMHMLMATEIITSGVVDEVWLCPYANGEGTDGTQGVPAQQRYILCEVAVNTMLSSSFPVRVSDHEARTSAPMATYDSLCWLRETYPRHEFSFVVGSDWLQPDTDLRTWTSKDGCTGDKLVSEFDFLVFPHAGYDVPDLSVFGPRFKWMSLPDGFSLVESNASSNEIHKRAQQGYMRSMASGQAADHQDMDGLVPPAVLAYVRRHSLYKNLAYKRLWESAGDHVRELLSKGKEKEALALVQEPGSKDARELLRFWKTITAKDSGKGPQPVSVGTPRSAAVSPVASPLRSSPVRATSRLALH
jgi:nicotinate (nicotinamide) nucleotide adenylyltransferase